MLCMLKQVEIPNATEAIETLLYISIFPFPFGHNPKLSEVPHKSTITCCTF